VSNHELWMWISGVIGFSCFVVIHFTKLLKNPLYAGLVQLASNVFVFVSWGSAYISTRGSFALFGVIFPIVTGTITIRTLLRARRQS